MLLGQGVVALGGVPQQASELFAEARRYEQAGDLKNAEKAYIRYLEEFPGSAQAHANLGVVYSHETKFDQAIDEYRSALCVSGDIDALTLVDYAARLFSSTPRVRPPRNPSFEPLCPPAPNRWSNRRAVRSLQFPTGRGRPGFDNNERTLEVRHAGLRTRAALRRDQRS